jgi:serine/threonine protein kinase/Tol biopolymer transport system component
LARPRRYNPTPLSQLALNPGARLGPYEITVLLGVGGMGEVYRATDTNLKRQVAIKVLPASVAGDPERFARFQREAEVLGALNHPNIAHIHGLEKADGTIALVMELVEGQTLADRIAQGPIPIDEALPIAKQIAEALEAAHEQGIIHRDLKPANIKVRPDGTAKVLDFGLAKALDPLASSPDVSQLPTIITSPAMTQLGMILGTAAYMSPEQARGKTVDKRADIWAFGAVMFEMLSGDRAFTGETISDTLASVVKTDPDWSKLPATAPVTIRRLLKRCLAKDPKLRLQAIGEARIALSEPHDDVESVPVVRARSVNGSLPWAIAIICLLTALAIVVVHFGEAHPTPTSIRFQVGAPEKTAISVFQLSPDGRRLAFVTNGGAPNRLWVRSFDSLNTVSLAGTDGATYPFWSPDSTRIGFFAQGQLKTIAADGGLAVPVCPAANGRGGTWNRDGVILFSPDSVGGLYRVTDTGGTPVPATTVASAPNESDRFPEFLPDGVRFLFMRLSNGGGIYVGSLADSSVTRLLPDLSNAQYVPGDRQAGFLLFRRADTLMAQPFDPNRVAASGGPLPFAEGVGSDAQTGHGAFASSTNGTVANRSGVRGGNRQLVWLDRTGKRGNVVSRPDEINSWALSPDGRTVVLSIGNGSEGAADLWRQDVDGGTSSKLTFGPTRSVFPVWSPNSNEIAFSAQPSVGIFQINGLRLTGSEPSKILLQGPYSSINVYDWSPDGKYIVFSTRSAQTNDDLFLLSTESHGGAAAYVQTPGDDRQGHFSPDSQWLAYQSNVSGRNEVYVQHVPLNGKQYQISYSGGGFPQWSRDGKELFYLRGDQTLMSVPVTAGSTFDSRQEHVVFADVPFFTPLGGSAFQPSEDGQKFLALLKADGDPQASSITVVTSWQTTLKK